MKQVLSNMKGLVHGMPITRKALFLVTFLAVLSASAAFALAVPTAGIGFAFYTILNGVYTTGLGYVAAAIMFFWGCAHLAKDWKDSLGWMSGGLGIASLPALVSAAGLLL